MKTTPILMQGPLVLASLRGDKTQTRRNQGLKEINEKPDGYQCVAYGAVGPEDRCGAIFVRLAPAPAGEYGKRIFIPCPWGGPGDLFYVREMWRPIIGQSGRVIEIEYEASQVARMGDLLGDTRKWKPSIHMFRSDSRLTGRLIDVRMERVKEISREDAIAEGISRVGGGMLRWENWSGKEGQSGSTPQAAFALLYESINGPGSFDSRWNWVLVYEPIAENVDAVLARQQVAS